MSPLGRVLTANPVLDRELRQRSRGTRPLVLLVLFLLALLATAALVQVAQGTRQAGFADPWSMPQVQVAAGRAMLEWLLAVMLFVLLFILPGLSANAVSGERERQTLVPLQVTLMGPLGILVGKIAASSAFALLLVVAAAPVLALPYLVGGVSLGQVVLSLLVLATSAVVVATIGVSCSTIFRRTQTATLMAYGVVLVLVLGTPLALAGAAIIDASRGVDLVETRWALVYPNPFVGLADAAGGMGDAGPSPFSPLKRALWDLDGPQEGFMVVQDDGGGPVAVPPDLAGPQARSPDGMPVWIRSMLFQVGLCLVLLAFAWRRLRTPAAVDR